MIDIVNVKEFSGGLAKAIQYIHGVWGDESNYNFYQDAIENSSLPDKALPQFYLMLKENKIIGCSALITNDFISRHDLYPWMACLYVNEEERGHSYARLLIEYAEDQARKAGFSNIYLTTDHAGYYEKYGWQRIEDGIDLFSGQATRIYAKKL